MFQFQDVTVDVLSVRPMLHCMISASAQFCLLLHTVYDENMVILIILSIVFLMFELFYVAKVTSVDTHVTIFSFSAFMEDKGLFSSLIDSNTVDGLF